MIAQPLGKRLNHPALFANDDQIYLVARLPKPLEGFKRLGVSFSRFDRAYHQEAWSGGKRNKGFFGLLGQVVGGSALLDIRSEVEPSDLQWPPPRRAVRIQPSGEFISDSTGNAYDAVSMLVQDRHPASMQCRES